jgi:hypothetical protein
VRYYLFSLMVQVLVALHALRTGRDRWWIWVILVFPMVGAVVYFFAEVLPELAHGRTGRRVTRAVVRKLDPDRELRETAAALAQVDSVENRIAHAEACIESGRGADAEQLYRGALVGVHAEDPHLMVGLARAQAAQGRWPAVRSTLETLIRVHPDFRSPEGHLLYARALDELAEVAAARHEYEALVAYYAGPEPRCRLALLERRAGRPDRAARLLGEVAVEGKRAARNVRALHREWYELAERDGT